MPNTGAASYLVPYLNAAELHGAAFPSLLWASPTTQRLRFDAICRAHPLDGKRIVDAGCGRADFLDYLLNQGVRPAGYIGIEAVEELAAAGEARAATRAGALPITIQRADFVREEARLDAGADVIVFSGSLNTMNGPTFYSMIERAFHAAGEAIVFNFLCSAALAGKEYLVWHRREHVERFARRLTPEVRAISDYLPGDCTLALLKSGRS